MKRTRNSGRISKSGFVESSGNTPLDDVAAFSANLPAAETGMAAGHLPSMERLASYMMISATELR